MDKVGKIERSLGEIHCFSLIDFLLLSENISTAMYLLLLCCWNLKLFFASIDMKRKHLVFLER